VHPQGVILLFNMGSGNPANVGHLGNDCLLDFNHFRRAVSAGEHLYEVIMRRYENRSTIMTSNQWGKLLGDVPTVGAILDRFLHHARTVAITGRSYHLKDHATVAGKEDKNKKTKSKSNEPSTAEPAS
jgi:hypothetical protein